ncbi:hypothetical protein [Halorubrum ezzemoulense]|uniref:hypothetical protein n=1 Tax=Halorubrum ezzemoulense TaxID=337243 RepID=UPI0015C65CB5|nr:hypothetical protein [Halorubrum ezzemoulense]
MSGDRAQTVLDFVVGMSENEDGAGGSASKRPTSSAIYIISLGESIVMRYDASG